LILSAFPFKTEEGKSETVHFGNIIESPNQKSGALADGLHLLPSSTSLKDSFVASLTNFLIVADIPTSIIAVSGQRPHSSNLLQTSSFLKV
jgi:hypothetical protein